MSVKNMIDKLFMRRWGFTVSGIRCKLKFLINRSLRYLIKSWSSIYNKWDWFKTPFNLEYCTFRTSDNLMFRVYDRDAIPVTHEQALLDVLQSILSKGSVFIDVGAHVGGFTVRASKIVGETGLVIAFEPDFRNYYFLITNIILNKCKNVIALPLAIYSITGGILSYNIAMYSGHSSITDLHEDEILFKTYVYTVTIDDMVKILNLRRIDAIKVDVEGAEIEVLKGAKESLARYKPILLIEVHGEKQWKLLKETLQNYTIKKVIRASIHNQWPRHIVATPV